MDVNNCLDFSIMMKEKIELIITIKTKRMRVINTITKDITTDADFTLVAKEMVNIYLGVEYYDLSNPNIINRENPKQKFVWSHNGTEYEYIPSLGYINIICNKNLTEGEEKAIFDKIRNALYDKFKRLLCQDNRISTYKHHCYGTEQFTLEEYEQPKLMHEYNIYDIDEQTCFKIVSKHDKTIDLNYGFIWILNITKTLDDVNFIYGDVKYDPEKYVKDMSSIIFNITHFEPTILQHLRYDATMLKISAPGDVIYFDSEQKLQITELGGIDFEIYKLLGGVPQGYLPSKSRNTYESNRYHTQLYDFRDDVKVYKWPTNITQPKFYIVGEHIDEFANDASKKIKACKAKESGEICGMCQVELFDDYYIITQKHNTAKAFRACRFCIHHPYNMVHSINIRDHIVFRTIAALTWQNVIDTKCKDIKLANLLKNIKLAITESQLVKYNLDNYTGIKPTNQQLLLINDAFLQRPLQFTERAYDRKIVVSEKYKFIGLTNVSSKEVIISLDVFKPCTVIFHYS
jgi:hypothetical protein